MKSLVIGFSFSLHADGAPGLYNHALASHLLKLDFEEANFHLQWEIAEAIREQDPVAFNRLKSRLQVVQPPYFLPGDVLFSRHDFMKAQNAFQERFLQLYHSAKGEIPLERMNQLLEDAELFKKFPDLVLPHLLRPKFGALFTEQRVLPDPKIYPNGLNDYHKVRVNRLIVDAVINDDSLVKPMPYMSTLDVIENALNADEPVDNHSIRILAHPLHAPRCRHQLNQALVAKNLERPIEIEPVELEFWDESSAQVWCQSESNWLAYEAEVAKMLARSG